MKLNYVAAAALAGVANAVPTITATGSKFFTSDGNQFFMKGTDILPPRLTVRVFSTLTFAQVLPTNWCQMIRSLIRSSAVEMLPS
jgi:hypothetical protein